MYYVYSLFLESGRENNRENNVGIYNTAKEAIERITLLYKLDEKSCMKGQYYYFMKRH